MIFFFSILAMLMHGQTAAVAADTPTTPVTASITLGTEAWYDESETCLAAGICTPSTNATAAADTLSVASQLGTESARTYLQIPAGSLPAGAVVTGGLLRMQLDTSATDGSLEPGMGLLKACATSSPIVAAAGLTTTPPSVDCTVSTPGMNLGSPTSEVDFDLAPLAGQLSLPGTSLAIESAVVSASADPANATFHDVFPSEANTTLAAMAPSLSLDYDAPAVAATDPTASDSAAAPTSSDAPSEVATAPAQTVTPTTGHGSSVTPVTGTVATPATPVAAAGAQPPAVTPAAPVAAAPVGIVAAGPAPAPVVVGGGAATEPSPAAAVGGVVLGGGSQTDVAKLGSIATTRYYDYPEVFFLPLLLGCGIFALGRQLTRPLTPEKEQEIS